MFEGNKIIVTPGLVELGTKEYDENITIGEMAAKVATKIVIVNKANKEAITKGLLLGNYNEENILFAENLEEAKKLLQTFVKSGDVILFQNDLPDNYT